MAAELVRRIQDAQAFLTMAAIELRRISEEAPDVAAQLLHISQQLEAEVENLVGIVPDRRAEA